MSTSATNAGLVELTIDGKLCRCPLERPSTMRRASMALRFARRTVSRGADDSSLRLPWITTRASCATAASAAATKSKQFRSRAHGQGLFRRHRLRSEFAMGDSTCISCGECMVFLPHRRADKQRRGGHGHRRGPRRAEPDGGGTSQAAGIRGRSGTFLELNRGAIVKQRYRKGEVISREGEFGSTAFYILEGKAQVAIATPIAHVKTQGGTIQ